MTIMMNKILALFLISFFCSCSKSGGGTSTPKPTVTISNASQTEGTGAGTTMKFTINLSAPYDGQVTVTVSTLDGTAKAGLDFIAITNQAIVFQAGDLQKELSVSIIADAQREGDENFSVMLTGATNANIEQFTATGTILNDDVDVDFNDTGYDAPDNYPGYTLAWADEFDAGSLNSSIWSFESGDGCPAICGWGNNELEYYRPENLFFQDGKMIIEAKKENFGGKEYTSSKILTRDKKHLKFGRIDVRAILPKGKGIWPAFWLLPQHNLYGGWPKSGEIDLMEMVGHEPNKSHGTIHYGPGPGSTQITRSYTLPSGIFNDEFHVFSLEWSLDQIKWYIDGNLFSTVNRADLGAMNYPFNEEFFFIINLAVGGNWPGNPDANTDFPQFLIVDYVRWYQ